MRVEDLTLEVRDRNLTRIGQIAPAYMNLTARTRWCGAGEWEVTLPGSHPMVGPLATPGSGIILLGPSGTPDGVILSGPTRSPRRVRDQQNPDGTYTFSGVTDEVLIQGAVAFPNPSIAGPAASSASRSNDTRTGKTEALLRQFVTYNIGSGAPAGRLRGLREHIALGGSDQGRGLTQTRSPRFQNLLEVLQEIVAYDPSLGFRLVQVGGALEFQVLDSRDRTKFVRFDIENGTVTSEEVQQGGPVVTDVIVAGQGEGKERTIVQRRDALSIAAEEEWGVPFERFKDQRDTDALAELQQAGDAELLDGQGGTAVKMVPADDTTMRVGTDWRAGDSVTVIVAGVETVARVTEVAYMATSGGVRAGAALGDVSGFTRKDAESAAVKSIDSRVSNLERASAGPVDWDRIINEPTSFPAAPQGTYRRAFTDPPSAWPDGISYTDAASGDGWPTTYCTILSVRMNDSRQFQMITEKAVGTRVWVRASVDSSNWGPLVQTAQNPDLFATATHTHAWGEVTGVPSTFPPSTHTHSAADITSGTLNAARLPALDLNVAGMVQMTAAAAAPSGWLLCDGAAVSRTTYAALFAAIGTTYGAGNGSSTFNLPNLKGRVPVGLDSAQTEFNTRGKTGGAKTHTLSQGEIPAHTHGPGADADGFMAHRTNATGGYSSVVVTGSSGDVVSYRIPQVNLPNGGAHNNLQPYLILNYIIKT